MESINILDLSNEILSQIVEYAENDENLRLTCIRFYELVCDKNKSDESLYIDTSHLFCSTIDYDSLLESSKIDLILNNEVSWDKNFEEKLESFLQQHGRRVKIFGFKFPLVNFFTKFIPLLPNVEKIYLGSDITLINIQVEKFSIKVKQLEIHSEINDELLDAFDIETLRINYVEGEDLKRYIKMLHKWKNLKKLIFYYCVMEFDFTKAFRKVKLDEFEATMPRDKIDHRMLGNILRVQKNLKKLRCFGIPRKTFTIICDNLKHLEELTIGFWGKITVENFQKISKLKKLKSLSIVQFFNQECFNELIRTESLQNLEYLEIFSPFQLSSENIVILAANFPYLKSLKLSNCSLSIEVLTTIFEHLNQLHCLKLEFDKLNGFQKCLMKDFLDQNHQNLNLKKLHISIGHISTSIRQFIRKIIRDFPNLESIGFFCTNISTQHVKMLLKNLKNLTSIADFTFRTSQHMEILRRYGQNLEKFMIDYDDANCRYDFDELNDCVKSYYLSHRKTIRVNKRKCLTKSNWLSYSGLSFVNYCEWKKLWTMMNSRRNIKKLDIRCHWQTTEFELNNFIKYLDIIGQNVELLILSDFDNFYTVKCITDALPNCKALFFSLDFLNEPKTAEVYSIDNRRLEQVNLNLKYFNYRGCCVRYMDIIFKTLKLNNLNYFVVTCRNQDQENIEKVFAISEEVQKKCLEFQPQLTKVTERYDKTELIYELIFSKEHLYV